MRAHALRAAALVTVFSVCLLAAAEGSGQDCIDYNEYMHWVTRLDVEGACNAVAIGGHHAYLATHSSTFSLQVVDLSLPEDPQLVGSLALPNWCEDVAVAGDLVFTANLNAGVQVIDIADPSAPVVLSSILTPDAVRYVDPHGDQVVASEWDTGLVLVIDVSDPTEPQILGTVPCEDDIWGQDVADGYAYVIYHTPHPGNGGLQVIDLADPTQPTIVANVATGDWAWDVTVADNHAYVLAGGQIEVYDLSDPATPTLVGSGGHGGRRIAVAGDIAYVGSGGGDTGVRVHDISDPTSPTLLGMVRTYDESRGVAVYGEYVMMANTYSGLNVIDVRVPMQPPIVNAVDEIGNARSQTIADGRAYLTSWASLRIVDLSTPTEPTLLSVLASEGYVVDVAATGGFAYMIDDSTGLHVVDVSVPTSPVVVGHWDDAGIPRNLDHDADHLYVTHVEAQEELIFSLKVLNIATPESPLTVGSVTLPYGAWRVAVADQTAYVSCAEYAGFSGLVLVDVSDPTAPQQVGSVALPGGWYNDVAVADRRVYVATDAYGVQIVDVNDPGQPFVLGNTMAPAPSRAIAVAGDFLYTAMRESGLAVHDISDPAAPEFLGHTSDDGEAWSIDLWGGYVYMPITGRYQVCYEQCDDSVPILEEVDDGAPPVPVTLATRLTAVAPNPFNPRTTISFTVEHPQELSIVIHDAAGRRVIEVASEFFATGEHRLVWDGRDHRGRSCASGLYLVHLRGEDSASTIKMVLTR